MLGFSTNNSSGSYSTGDRFISRAKRLSGVECLLAKIKAECTVVPQYTG